MEKRTRVVLPKQPEWDKNWERYTASFIHKNKWKCEFFDEFDDLMHDAYIIFRRIKATYPLISEPRHIMALYKTALWREFIDKAQKKRQKTKHEVSLEYIVGEDLRLLDTLGEHNNEGYLRVLINELPPELKSLVAMFYDQEKLAQLRSKDKQSRLAALAKFPRRKLSIVKQICEVMGLPPNTDLHGMLRRALIERG